MRKDTNRCLQIGHVNEYPTMHDFRNPRHRQSLIAYMILIYLFILIIDTMHTPRSYFIHHFLGFEDDAKEPLIQPSMLTSGSINALVILEQVQNFC